MVSDRAENNEQCVFTDSAKGGKIEECKVRVIFDDASSLTIDNPAIARINGDLLEIHEEDCSYYVSMTKVRFVEAEHKS